MLGIITDIFRERNLDLENFNNLFKASKSQELVEPRFKLTFIRFGQPCYACISLYPKLLSPSNFAKNKF